MLPELVVLEGLLHRLDGCVVDVQQLLHRSYREDVTVLLMFSRPWLIKTIASGEHDESASWSLVNRAAVKWTNALQENRGWTYNCALINHLLQDIFAHTHTHAVNTFAQNSRRTQTSWSNFQNSFNRKIPRKLSQTSFHSHASTSVLLFH